jgi:hypothetical protein
LGPTFMSMVTANGPSMSTEVTGGRVPTPDPAASCPPSPPASDPGVGADALPVGDMAPVVFPLPDGSPPSPVVPAGAAPESAFAVAAGLGNWKPAGRPSPPPLEHPRHTRTATTEIGDTDMHFSFMTEPVQSIHVRPKSTEKHGNHWATAPRRGVRALSLPSAPCHAAPNLFCQKPEPGVSGAGVYGARIAATAGSAISLFRLRGRQP